MAKENCRLFKSKSFSHKVAGELVILMDGKADIKLKIKNELWRHN